MQLNTATMNALTCAFCLSSDKHAFFLGEKRFHFIYSLLAKEDGQFMTYLQAEGKLRVCWHCLARVNSCASFARSARRSLQSLNNYLSSTDGVPPASQSSLGLSAVHLVDIDPRPSAPEARGLSPTKEELPVSEISKDSIKFEYSAPDDNSSDVDCPLQEIEPIKKEKSIEAAAKVAANETVTKKRTVKKKSAKAKVVSTPDQPASHLCKRCKETFTSLPLLRQHRLSCVTYKCAKCEKTFSNKFTYFDHLPLHKEGGADKLFCQICDKQFTNAKWFKTHFRTSLKHVSRDTFQHECPHCKLRFHIAQRLKEHVAAKHLNRGLYACDLCPKSFAINKSLKKHCARVHNIGTVSEPARDKVCEHCGKAFTSTWFLSDHQRLHTGERPYRCRLCPAAFPQHGTLYVHTLVVHRKRLAKDGLVDSPACQCDACGKQFASPSRMRAHHKVVHLKLGRFNCELCHVLFSSLVSLKNHLASRHGVLSTDTFKCDTCGKRYNTNTALRAHAKRHGVERSVHRCRACDAEFKSSSGLQLHFKYVHLKLKRNDKVTLKNVGDPDKELIINGEPQGTAGVLGK